MGQSQRAQRGLSVTPMPQRGGVLQILCLTVMGMVTGCGISPSLESKNLKTHSSRFLDGGINLRSDADTTVKTARWYGFWFHKKTSSPGVMSPTLRLVTEEHELEVFSGGFAKPESPASQDIAPINWRPLPDGLRWIVVELWGSDFSQLRGEVDRWGPFALVELPWNALAHEWLGSHVLHVSELETFEGEFVHEMAAESTFASPSLGEGALGSSKGIFSGEGSSGQALSAAILASLESKVQEFSGAVPLGSSQRISERGSDKGRLLARDWLRNEFVRLGYSVSEHTYRGRFSEGYNLVAERPGREFAKTLIVSSHYDSVGNPGADDNGAGVVGMLALAEKLQSRELDFNLRMVFFDQEEKGLVGSKAYVDYLKAQGELPRIMGNINFEMLGYDSNGDGALHIIDCNENTSAQLSASVMKALGQKPELGLQRVAACTNRSDHASFWRYGIPAIVVSENFFGGDGNPCYHKTCDQVNQMNFRYMARIIELMAETIAQLQGS